MRSEILFHLSIKNVFSKNRLISSMSMWLWRP